MLEAAQTSLFDAESGAVEIVETVARFRLELVQEEVTEYVAPVPFDRPETVAAWAAHQIETRPQEHMIAGYLSTRQRLLGWSIVSVGTINRAAVEPRSIFQAALALNAAGFVIAHNYPSGDPTPSAEDLAFTRRIAEAGDIVGVRLVDHLVIGGEGRWVSLRKRGAF